MAGMRRKTMKTHRTTTVYAEMVHVALLTVLMEFATNKKNGFIHNYQPWWYVHISIVLLLQKKKQSFKRTMNLF